MNYGLYLSAAGVLTNMHRQDVYANNLANINTTGFQPDAAVTQQRLPERLEDPTVFADPQRMLERLGGGVLQRQTKINFTQGALEQTNSQLDVALQGDGFLLVGTPGSPSEWSLTRDGRLTRDAEGHLAMASTGRKVLNTDGQAIYVEAAGEVSVKADGAIEQNGEALGMMRVVMPSRREDLVKQGGNLFGLKAGFEDATNLLPSSAQVTQFHIENSGVDPIMTLNSMIGAAKAAKGAAKMMQYHDFTMNLAIGTLGRVR